MKKIALVLCAMMTLSCMNSVFAATVSDTTTSSRNTTESFATVSTDSMPSFRAGDTLSFNVSGLAEGTQLTIISYKVNGGEIGNDTVQYIDQRTIKSDTDKVEYKIRDINDGIYCVAVKDGNSSAYTLYYKVGTPKVEVIKGAGNTDYYVTEENKDANGNTVYSVGYLAAASFKTDELSLEDYGISGFGFRYSLEGYEDADVAPTEAQVNELKKQIDEWINGNEVQGEFSFYYINTIKNVPAGDEGNITAKATMYNSDNTITVGQ